MYKYVNQDVLDKIKASQIPEHMIAAAFGYTYYDFWKNVHLRKRFTKKELTEIDKIIEDLKTTVFEQQEDNTNEKIKV